MRTDQSENHKGGAKKFLYSGPQPKNQQEDQWNFTTNGHKQPPTNFDLDDVWSIKKNVSLGNKPPLQSQDSLNLNVKKNYYSRYGNLNENDSKDLGSGSQSDVGKTWNSQQKPRFSYAPGVGLDPTGGRLSHGSNHSDDSLSRLKTGQAKGSSMGTATSRYF